MSAASLARPSASVAPLPPRAAAVTVAGELEIRAATAEDDPDIRALLAAAPVEGPIVLAYEREPNYFLGLSVMGRRVDTLVARLSETGDLVGVATRSVRPLWINGGIRDVGYLGHLRVGARYRGRSLVQRGFRVLREMDRQAAVPGYLTTIVEGNSEALGVLVRRARPGMPSYRERARVRTLVIPTRAGRRRPDRQVEIADGGECGLDEILKCLRRAGPVRQFFPAYEPGDFLPGATLTRGFDTRNFLAAAHGGAICGALGVWDQSAFKQVVVRGYRGGLAYTRRLVALVAPLLGYPSPPRAPAELRIAYASFLAVDEDREDVFDALLRAALQRAARLGCDYLTFALAETDPLLRAGCAFPHRAYFSRLFTVDWQDGAFHDEVARGIPYVDIASF